MPIIATFTNATHMHQFDLSYFTNLILHLNHKVELDKWHPISNFTKDYDKFLFHLCYYIDATCNPPHEGWKHVELQESTTGPLPWDNFRVLSVSIARKVKIELVTATKAEMEFYKKNPFREYTSSRIQPNIWE